MLGSTSEVGIEGREHEGVEHLAEEEHRVPESRGALLGERLVHRLAKGLRLRRAHEEVADRVDRVQALASLIAPKVRVQRARAIDAVGRHLLERRPRRAVAHLPRHQAHM